MLSLQLWINIANWVGFSYEFYENVSSDSLKGQEPEIPTVSMATQQDMVPWNCAAF
jgi:hypothetical protein